jgi:hypothetical protein
MGIDTIPIFPKNNMFGFANENWKEWQLDDGNPVLVPRLFNVKISSDGSYFQYPEGDKNYPPCAKMPAMGVFFDSIIRQEKIDENKLSPEDNLEEFNSIKESELKYFKSEALKASLTKKAVVYLSNVALI